MVKSIFNKFHNTYRFLYDSKLTARRAPPLYKKALLSPLSPLCLSPLSCSKFEQLSPHTFFLYGHDLGSLAGTIDYS